MQATSHSTPNLLKQLLLERWPWRLLVLACALASALSGVLSPYYQKNFVDGLLSGNPVATALWMAFALGLLSQALVQLNIWLTSRESIVSQKQFGDALYHRVLEGPGGFLAHRPVGEAVSLFAVDVPGATAILDQALASGLAMLFPILIAPLTLHALYGIPAPASWLAITGLAGLNFFLARRQSYFFYRFKQLAAERTGLVSEWVQNIRPLRILGRVATAERHIFQMRKKETDNRKAMVTNGQIMNTLAGSSTYLLNILAVLMLLNLRGNHAPPTAGELLSLLWIVAVFLARPLRQLPWTLVIVLDSLSSIKRLQNAFDAPLSPPRLTGHAPLDRPTPAVALEVRKLNLNIQGRQLLSDIDLALTPGELVGIVGEVGSGKSLLLQALVGAVGVTFERFAINGADTAGPDSQEVRQHMAYVPQDGVTVSATLFENVVFEYGDRARADTQEVRSSLKLCQFDPEEEHLSEGLQTEIGERGVNLSGGQRQRIGLARAHFTHRPLIIMDDCLSAVDVDTEKKLIDRLLRGDWARATRLLATHRTAVLPLCDRLLFLQDGKIAMEGTYQQMLERSPAFREFIFKETVPAPVSTQPQPLPDLEETAPLNADAPTEEEMA
ncbi:MAG: hypothetical protein A2X86_02770 [Bdellovibrionales bacterium GWA2_49_15]|nr:MAG: hypothetical protein A2X86_02770 [Bdellovibrionales bacterium GWA2_49_15]HAZ14138.1 ABC transporter permease [Bdellovibrionales bacterium]